MSDFEVTENGDGDGKKNTPPDDIGELVTDGIFSISIFTIFISLIIYVVLDSNIYANYILKPMSGSFVDDIGNKTLSGTVITGGMFGLLLSLTESMHQANWI